MDATLRAKLLDVLRIWAAAVDKEIEANGVFLFGSLVYRDGDQFNPATSDIDLIVLVPTALKDAVLASAQWLAKLRDRKAELERSLGALLPRADLSAPMASVVPVTGIEIAANIHKDGAREFFSSSRFLELATDKLHDGLPHAGEQRLDNRLITECLRFAQKKRNAFVDVNLVGHGGIAAFADPSDPAPKDTMRHAAMAAALRDGVNTPG